MGQEFVVVRCCSCEAFQVDIKKTSTNKWTCKLCGTKQSLKQIFWLGSSGKEGREQVQTLNLMRGELAMQNAQIRLQQIHDAMMAQNEEGYVQEAAASGDTSTNVFDLETEETSRHVTSAGATSGSLSKPSKWSKYLTPKED